MINYKVMLRQLTRIDSHGERKTWTSTTYYISYYQKGVRVWKNTELTDKEKAEEYAKNFIATLEKGTVLEFLKQNHWFEPAKSPAFIDSRKGNISWKLNYAQSRKNSRYLQIILEKIKDPIGECLFENVSRKDTQAFRERLKDLKSYKDGRNVEREVTSTFKNNVLSAFRVTWKYYMKTGAANVEKNPFQLLENFKDVKEEHKHKYIFTPDDYKDLFNRELLNSIEPITTFKSKHDGTEKPLTKEKWSELVNSFWIDFFELAFLTGARGGELAALRVKSFPESYEGYVMVIDSALKSGLRKSDVNNEIEEVKVFDETKTGEERKIVLCDRAREIAAKYCKGKKPDDLLFSTAGKDGNRYSTLLTSQKRSQVFNLFINEMDAQIGLLPPDSNDVLSLHGFRTSLNTQLLAAGNKEWVVAYALGWQSRSLTQTQGKHYTKVEIPDLIELAATINQLYFGIPFTWRSAAKKRATIDRQQRVANILNASRKIRWINQLRSQFLEIRQKFLANEYDEYNEDTVNAISEFLDYSVEELNKKNFDFFEPYLSKVILDEEVQYADDHLGLQTLLRSYEKINWAYYE